MKYTQEIVINAPQQKVAEWFADLENLKYWHPHLVSIEHLSGEPRSRGARTRMVYETKKGTFELVETVTVNDLPRVLSGIYETVGKGFANTMRNSFSPVDENTTRYEVEIEYTFTGLLTKIVTRFMAGTFKKQSYRSMELFKEFVEREARST